MTSFPLHFDLAGKRIWIAGHRGMVGSALMRRLALESKVELLTAERSEVDLTRQSEVNEWLATQRPDAIILAAAKVGGISANDSYPADFIYQNLMIEANVISAAANMGVSKLIFLGSSCIYPKFADQPIGEECLLTGSLEPTNEWYAVAKIAGIKLCQAYRKQHGCDFISVMPTNLYGPGDNYHIQDSHVMAALIRRAHEAKIVKATQLIVWGTGTPLREFMYVDDLADALVFLLKNYSSIEHINVGVGYDISIASLAKTISKVVGFEGQLTFDSSKPDGTPRKLMDSRKLTALGWQPQIALEYGLQTAYKWYVEHSFASAK